MPQSHRVRALAVAVSVLLVAQPAAPTTVIAPTFDELVSGAESVVVANVVDVRSAWIESRSGRAIVTDVTCSIDRTLKGPAYAQTIARVPRRHGGRRDAERQRHTRIPPRRPRRPVHQGFGRPASPIVGLAYGRFRIIRDTSTGVQMIRTHDGRPLATIGDVGNPRPPAFVQPARMLSLDEFLSAIDGKVRALGRQ
jgi:hypothetical protein